MPTKTTPERIEKAHKKLVVPMEKIDRNNLDLDLVHDIALMAMNTENLLVPTLKSLQKKYKKGTYDSTLALLAWHHVAKVAVSVYKHKFYYPTLKINRFELIAIAEDIREQVEDANMHKEVWS